MSKHSTKWLRRLLICCIAVFVLVVIVRLVAVIVLPPLSHTSHIKNAQAIFCADIGSDNVTTFNYVLDSQIGGYDVYARCTLSEGADIASLLRSAEQGNLEDRFDVNTKRAARFLVAPGGQTRLVSDELLPTLASKLDWRADTFQAAAVYLTKGKNALTHSYWHWWIVPECQTNLLYLIGKGI